MTDYKSPGESIQSKEVATLRSLIMIVPACLCAITEEEASAKVSPDRWSLKEELGHLIDSATNNHQRIARTLLEDQPAFRVYNGDQWVKLHAYHKREWQEVIEQWRAINKHMLRLVEELSEKERSRACTVGDSQPLTLEFIIRDYLGHMLSHLRHIGVDVDGLQV